MSRGPGKIERAIRQLMADQPDGAWTVEDLAERVYPGVNQVEKKHRVSVLRVLKKVTADDPDWTLMRAENIGNTWILVNAADVVSYGLARLKAWNVIHYRSPDPRHHPDCIKTEADLRAQIEPGGRDHHLIQSGGAWDRHVKMHIARRDGDNERLAEFELEQRVQLARIDASLRR